MSDLSLTNNKNKHMKTKIYLLALLAFHCACNAENNDNNRAKNDLNGKIKSVKESYYRAGNTEGDFKLRSINETTFNKEGNKTSYIQYTSDGDTISKQLYTYDDKNNLIEDNLYNSYGGLSSNTTYKYDSKGNRVEEILFEEGYSPSKESYKYDDRNNIIEKKQYNPEGICWNKIRYKYDETGKMVEENHLAPDDAHIEKKLYKYDDNGNVIEVQSLSSLNRSHNYKTLSMYDDKNNLIEYSYIQDGNSAPFKTTYSYEFDEPGNWIKSTEFKDDIPQNKTEREIEYFD